MKPISYMLDPATGPSSNPDEPTPERRPPAPVRQAPRQHETGTTLTLDIILPSMPLDEDACSAFDRRPPLEAMASLWLNRASVVTVYDCGHDERANGAVYDAVFRLQNYVWIRSPSPLLIDDYI